MSRTGRWIAAAALLALGACGTSDPPAPPPPQGDFRSSIDLTTRLPANADPVGVAASPEGQLYVLDRNNGLYRIEGAGATLVFPASASAQLTDVVALGDERFALTAVNDGYMLDLHNQTFLSYFCYLPALPPDPAGDPGGPTVIPTVSTQLRSQGIEVEERTESVAFSPESLQLFAQPQTFRLDTGQVMGSELFVFSDGGGQPIAVQSMPSPSFIAGGMLAVDGQRLLLGSRNQIYTMDQGAGPTLTRTFDPSIDISGLARDTSGYLLLLDRAGRRLLQTTLD